VAPQPLNHTSEVSGLIREHRAPLARYARTVCPTTADAEDATQATMLSLFEQLRRAEPPRAVRAWLFTVVRNYCLRVLRTLRRWLPGGSAVDDPNLPAPHAPPDPEVAAIANRALDAIHGLDQESREVLVRRDVLGESGPDAARALGLSLAATKSRLHRARTSVRDAMSENSSSS